MMNIGIDCRVFQYSATGIGKYLLHLLRNLAELNDKKEYYLFYSELNSEWNILDSFKKINKFKFVKLSYSNLFIQNILLPYYIKKYNIDIFHCPANYGVPSWGIKNLIITLHDLTPLKCNKYWEEKPLIEKILYEFYIKQAIKKASKIICISHCTKKDLLEYFPIAEKKKIKVIYQGKSLNEENKNMLNYKKIKQPYIIHISSKNKLKNTHLVVEAFNLFKKEDSDVKLVIVGETYCQLIGKDVEYKGLVSDEELSDLLLNAEILLFVSFYEGFGLPVLDSFSLGVPVIGAKTAVNEELFKDKLYYIKTDSCEELADKIVEVLAISKTHTIVENLKNFSKKFNWQKTAKETLDFYNISLKK
jgi:glycosyltransferase involved in cell wall biosynthesis